VTKKERGPRITRIDANREKKRITAKYAKERERRENLTWVATQELFLSLLSRFAFFACFAGSLLLCVLSALSAASA